MTNVCDKNKNLTMVSKKLTLFLVICITSIGLQLIYYYCDYFLVENEYDNFLLSDDDEDLMANSTFLTPLNLRDIFLGGRTKMFKKYRKANGNSVIISYDANSLYSYIYNYANMVNFLLVTL